MHSGGGLERANDADGREGGQRHADHDSDQAGQHPDPNGANHRRPEQLGPAHAERQEDRILRGLPGGLAGEGLAEDPDRRDRGQSGDHPERHALETA